MLNADGGCDSAVFERGRHALKKFPEYLLIFTGNGFSLLTERQVHIMCIRICLTNGSETWLMKVWTVEHEVKLDRNIQIKTVCSDGRVVAMQTKITKSFGL